MTTQDFRRLALAHELLGPAQPARPVPAAAAAVPPSPPAPPPGLPAAAPATHLAPEAACVI